FGYVPASDPPAAPLGGRLVNARSVVVIVRSAMSSDTTTLAAIVGFGYVPASDPPAAPFGGRLVNDRSAVVIVPSTMLPVATEFGAMSISATDASAICEDPTTPAAIVGFGYVPASDPPAAPLGGRLVNARSVVV